MKKILILTVQTVLVWAAMVLTLHVWKLHAGGFLRLPYEAPSLPPISAQAKI